MKKHEIVSNALVAVVLFVCLIVFGRISSGEILEYSFVDRPLAQNTYDDWHLVGTITVDTDGLVQDAGGNYLIGTSYNDLSRVSFDYRLYCDCGWNGGAPFEITTYDNVLDRQYLVDVTWSSGFAFMATDSEFLLLNARVDFKSWAYNKDSYTLSYGNNFTYNEYSFQYAQNKHYGATNGRAPNWKRGWEWYYSGTTPSQVAADMDNENGQLVIATGNNAIPVPEPSSIILVLCGIATLTFIPRKGG